MLVLTQADVRALLDPDELVDALAAAFVALSDGAVSAPPRIAAASADGLLAAMPVHLPGAGLEVKVVSVFPGNHRSGLPSHQALIVLFDDATGTALAVMDGTHITAARTAGAAALATRVLAAEDAHVLAILGAGVEAAHHLDAVPRVRSFTEIRIANRTHERAVALAQHNPTARAVASFEEAVRGADVVCCCTHADEPVLHLRWLNGGTHVNSVGANFDGPELDEDTIRASRLVVESRVAFQPPPAGCVELQGIAPGSAAELGEVIAGRLPGRESAHQVTVYKSMGHAVEDAVAAHLVYERAMQRGVGRQLSLDGGGA
jgi:ornithine cyclodeaminase/alanine dehydrogenase-like protein (mu-crystallin family)